MISIKPITLDKHSLNPPKNCPGSIMAWDCGAEGEDRYFDDRKWRYEIFQKYPRKYGAELGKNYRCTYRAKGRFIANSNLRELDAALSQIDFKLASNEEALRNYAEELAYQCKKIVFNPDIQNSDFLLFKEIIRKEKVQIPAQIMIKKQQKTHKNGYLINKTVKKITKDLRDKRNTTKHRKETSGKPAEYSIGAINRLIDPLWWRRNLRKIHRQGLEKVALRLNLVNRRKAIYVSDESFKCSSNQRRKNNELLSLMKAVNELGQEFTLEELSKLSNSNPIIRRAELMTRIAGIELFSENQKHIGVFYTITCPSRMHASKAKSGKKNEKYDNTNPKEAQCYLNGIWQKMRAKLNRDGINIYGVRVAEPHHDGTPHWHLLVFMDRQDRQAVNSTFRKYALQDSPNEKGAQARRITYELINKEKGSATGYIAKYISKNIDGAGLETDEFGNSSNISSNRVNAWASTWCIRQFQFFGTPPISQWRELRRLSPECLPEGLVRECCKAADAGDWFQYMSLMGGINTKKMKYPITLLKVWSDELGKYGEPKGFITKGIECEGVSYISRIHTWTIENKNIPGGESRKAGRPLQELSWQGPSVPVTRNKPPLAMDFHPLEYCQ